MWMLIVGGGTVVVLFGLLLIVRAFRTGPTDAAAPAAGPRQAEAFLRDMSNISGQERYDITAGFVMVGRIASGLSGDYQDIVIDVKTIGRQHAVIEYRDHAYWIRDQGSLNGTFVNGTRIEAEVRLNHGDLIGFYDHQFRFGMPSMEASDKTVLAGDIGTDADRTVLAGLGSTSVPPQDTPAPARPPAAKSLPLKRSNRRSPRRSLALPMASKRKSVNWWAAFRMTR